MGHDHTQTSWWTCLRMCPHSKWQAIGAYGEKKERTVPEGKPRRGGKGPLCATAGHRQANINLFILGKKKGAFTITLTFHILPDNFFEHGIKTHLALRPCTVLSLVKRTCRHSKRWSWTYEVKVDIWHLLKLLVWHESIILFFSNAASHFHNPQNEIHSFNMLHSWLYSIYCNQNSSH